MTETYRKKYIICRALSILLTLLPILVYTILGFINGSTGNKIALGMCLLLALIFVLINVIFKHRIRTTIWIIMVGIYVCVNNIIPLLLLMAFSTALDEFILEPLYKSYKEKYKVNKEIDKRFELQNDSKIKSNDKE